MHTDDYFTDKVAFVTGGASGIGATVCRTLARLGTRVAIADRDHDGATALARELGEAGYDSVAIGLDVSDLSAVERAVGATVERYGALHFGVNNAGVVTQRGAVADHSPTEWDRCLAVNLTGVFYCMRAEIPAMLAAGGGAIVNTASICGVVAVANTAAYTASKHGVIGLTKTAALDYAEQGIRVNAVAPGYVDSLLLASRPPEERAGYTSRHPMMRLATTQDIADTIAFLLSDRAGFITGSVNMVDGGYSVR